MRSIIRGLLEQSRNEDAWKNPLDLKEEIPIILRFSAQMHQLYDNWEKEAAKQFESPIQCAKGCSNCCQHYPMSVEPFELIRLYAQIRTQDNFTQILEDCYRSVQRFHQYLDTTPPEQEEEAKENEALHRYFEAGQRCPLLSNNGSCAVHPFRPITCRMYFSFSDPRFCTPEFLLKPENRSFHLCLPDEIEEDFGEWKERFASLGLSESLYEGLLQLNTWEQDGIFE